MSLCNLNLRALDLLIGLVGTSSSIITVRIRTRETNSARCAHVTLVRILQSRVAAANETAPRVCTARRRMAVIQFGRCTFIQVYELKSVLFHLYVNYNST